MYKKKSKTKRNVIIVMLIIIIVLILGFVGSILLSDLKQEDILRNEIKVISKKDATKDRYNESIKTKEDYAVVEKAIKEYLDEYAVTLQKVYKIKEDSTLTNMLSIANYQKDGPEFKKSKEYIINTRKELNEGLEKLSVMTKPENIMKNIKNKNLNQYYNDLYKELMNVVIEPDINNSEKLKNASERVNNILDVEEQIIDLLIQNKDKWQIKDNKIVFQETETLNKYNELCKKITE